MKFQLEQLTVAHDVTIYGTNGDFQEAPIPNRYDVKPEKRWTSGMKLTSFQMRGMEFCEGDYVFIANERTLEERHEKGFKPEQQWVARILEIRKHRKNTLAVVAWAYWPSELKDELEKLEEENTPEERKQLADREGRVELILSNHVNIIDAECIFGHAQVEHWSSSAMKGLVLHWRYIYDQKSQTLDAFDPVPEAEMSPAGM